MKSTLLKHIEQAIEDHRGQAGLILLDLPKGEVAVILHQGHGAARNWMAHPIARAKLLRLAAPPRTRKETAS